jgi:hypothetical protein
MVDRAPIACITGSDRPISGLPERGNFLVA